MTYCTQLFRTSLFLNQGTLYSLSQERVCSLSLFDAKQEKNWGRLLSKAQKGDQSAYQSLLTELYPVVRSYLNKRVAFLCNVEDTTQEVIFCFHNASKTFDPSRRFGPWFFTVLRYKMLDILKAQSKLRKLEILSQDDSQLKAGVGENELESHDFVQKALAKIPEKYRLAFYHTKIEGLSSMQAAEKLQISEANLRKRASRACELLKVAIERLN